MMPARYTLMCRVPVVLTGLETALPNDAAAAAAAAALAELPDCKSSRDFPANGSKSLNVELPSDLLYSVVWRTSSKRHT